MWPCLLHPENQVKGLEDGEVDFLDFVSDRQLEIEKQRKDEVEQVLSECRVSLSYLWCHIHKPHVSLQL